MILTEGKIREQIIQNFRPLCDINLSIPLEAKRLVDLVLSGQIIIRDEKDLNGLKRNLDRALLSKSGRGATRDDNSLYTGDSWRYPFLLVTGGASRISANLGQTRFAHCKP